MIAPRRLFRATSLLLLLANAPVLGGTIAVEIGDSAGKPIEDAAVYAIPETRLAAAPRATAVMDQKDRMFIPHVLVIQTGTAVEFPNSDDIRHHVYSFSTPKPFQLPLYKGTPANPIIFDRPGVVTLGCNIHDRMAAFILIVDTPYFAKTDENGRAELRDVPSGKYGVRVWYERVERQPKPVTVTMSGDERHEVRFAPGGESADGGS